MNLKRFVEVVWYRRRLALGALCGALIVSILILKIERPVFMATAQVVSVGNSVPSSPSGNFLGLGDITTLVQSTDVLAQAIKNVKVDLTPEQLKAAVTVKGYIRSNIIDISASSKSPELSQQLANAVADALVKAYHDLASMQYRQIISSLKTQLLNQQHIIASVDKKLQDAAQADTIAASSHPLDAIMESLSTLQNQRAQAQASFIADSAAANAGLNSDVQNDVELRKVISEQALSNDPYYQALRAGQSKDAADYQFMRASFTKAYPGLAGLAAKVASETSEVRKAAQSTIDSHVGSSPTYATILLASRTAAAQVAGDKARLASLDQQIDDIHKRLHDLPSLGVPANQMRLLRDSAASSYQQLETRLQMTLADQQQAASLNSVIVMNYATNSIRKMPLSRFVLMLGLIVIGAVIGVIALAEKLRPALRDADDIKEHYGLPLLGVLS